MNKNNGQAWKTKYGPRRVRHEAPTLEEAIAAAQGLCEELDQQAEIAAALMGTAVRRGPCGVAQNRRAAEGYQNLRGVHRSGVGAAHHRGRAQTIAPVVGAADRPQRPVLSSAG
jgi:hypothetical protein